MESIQRVVRDGRNWASIKGIIWSIFCSENAEKTNLGKTFILVENIQLDEAHFNKHEVIPISQLSIGFNAS